MSVSAASAVASNPVKPSAWAPSEHAWALGHIPNLTWPLSIVAVQPTTAAPLPTCVPASARVALDQTLTATLPPPPSKNVASDTCKTCWSFFNFIWVRKTNKFPAEIKRITGTRGRACALKHLSDPLDVERDL